MFNQFIGIGRLTRDPETKTLTNGTQVTTFSIAINRRNEKVDFIPVETFGKLAELAEQYLSKGALVLIEGELHIDQWESEKGKRKATKVVANGFRVLVWNKEEKEVKAEEVPETDTPPF